MARVRLGASIPALPNQTPEAEHTCNVGRRTMATVSVIQTKNGMHSLCSASTCTSVVTLRKYLARPYSPAFTPDPFRARATNESSKSGSSSHLKMKHSPAHPPHASPQRRPSGGWAAHGCQTRHAPHGAGPSALWRPCLHEAPRSPPHPRCHLRAPHVCLCADENRSMRAIKKPVCECN